MTFCFLTMAQYNNLLCDYAAMLTCPWHNLFLPKLVARLSFSFHK